MAAAGKKKGAAAKAPKSAVKKIKLSADKQIEDLTLFDDLFMSAAFDDQKPMTELLLRRIMRKPDLIVISTRCEKSFANIGARSIRLDVFAKDSSGKFYNIEVQRAESGADVRRMRFHAALITAKLLAAGKDFKDLPEVCVIFICETDIFKKGHPLYEISRYNYQAGEPLNDGEQIIVVNGEIQDDTPLGTIMHDFSCKNPADAKNAVIRERLAYMKETKEGLMTMSAALEEWRKAVSKEEDRERVRNMFRDGVLTSPEQAHTYYPQFSLDELRRIEAEEFALA